MIIHKLILRHLGHRDDVGFYDLQASDAIRWLETQGVTLGTETRVLDLGCGQGILGAALSKRKCDVTFADETEGLMPELQNAPFRRIDLDQDDIGGLGSYDLVVCSNVFEHLAKPERFLSTAHSILKPNGNLYLTWTNWLSPWGGHEFSPFHYLGARRGHLVYDRLFNRPRKHTPGVNLFPAHIGRTLRFIRHHTKLRVAKAVPRYYPELSFILLLPFIREFITWNCAILLERAD